MIDAIPKGALIIRKTKEIPREFSAIIVDHNARQMVIGVAANFGSTIMATHSPSESGRVLIGYDDYVSIVDIETNREEVSHKVPGPFVEFIYSGNYILASAEIGFLCFDKNCRTKWQYTATDLIEHVEVSCGVLSVTLFDDGRVVSINIRTGTEV
jgi:outer membrane protein assembly factor BamB